MRHLLFHSLHNCIWGGLDRRKTDGPRSEISEKVKGFLPYGPKWMISTASSNQQPVHPGFSNAWRSCSHGPVRRNLWRDYTWLTYQKRPWLQPFQPNFRVAPTRSISASCQGNSRFGVYSLHYTCACSGLWNWVTSPWQPSWNWRQKPTTSSGNASAFLDASPPQYSLGETPKSFLCSRSAWGTKRRRWGSYLNLGTHWTQLSKPPSLMFEQDASGT